MTYGEKALQVARAELGVKEFPPNSNSGDRVKEFQAATDLKGTGWPWCAAFALWCYQRAGAVQPYRSASVGNLQDWYAKHDRLMDSRWVKPGDLVFYEFDVDHWPDHVGIFDHWIERGRRFVAVEGNTGLGNDANGGAVMERERTVAQVSSFGRPVGSRVRVGVPFDPVTGKARLRYVLRIRRGVPYTER